MVRVEVEDYRKPKVDGVIKGKFSLVIYPMGQKIIGCTHFKNERGEWFTFPAKDISKEGDEKKEYIPYISYKDKDYLSELKNAVMHELSTVIPAVNYGKKNKVFAGKESPVQGEPSDLWA